MNECNCDQAIDLKLRVQNLELICDELQNKLFEYEKPEIEIDYETETQLKGET